MSVRIHMLRLELGFRGDMGACHYSVLDLSVQGTWGSASPNGAVWDLSLGCTGSVVWKPGVCHWCTWDLSDGDT